MHSLIDFRAAFQALAGLACPMRDGPVAGRHDDETVPRLPVPEGYHPAHNLALVPKLHPEPALRGTKTSGGSGQGGLVMRGMSEAHFAVLRRHMVEVIAIQAELASEELGKPALDPRVL